MTSSGFSVHVHPDYPTIPMKSPWISTISYMQIFRILKERSRG